MSESGWTTMLQEVLGLADAYGAVGTDQYEYVRGLANGVAAATGRAAIDVVADLKKLAVSEGVYEDVVDVLNFIMDV